MYLPSPWLTFLHWLLLNSLILFAGLLLWQLDILLPMLQQDVTRICALALLVFALASGHCGYRAWWLAREFRNFDAVRLQQPVLASLSRDYLASLGADEAQNSVAAEVLAERAKGNHQLGWFVTGVLVKLGLLGTVIGFILMLGSVSGLENLDTSDIKQLMQQMTEGMGVAMNTTLVGLVCSMLLGLQYLLLDRAADRLVVETIRLGQSRQEV
ncbi:MotA/TolQ/ExbB proton channel family protein [Oceanobacter mangrovi]|uniref:MotA/TolQ/ExbB proton channel family protein n=1 Tax=Oceanobacter mangrovi TaxID=2862510 RepID=UPI001C8DA09E|nr:MotA/TolQ/ExbB proton channel family protein [Oceanobacter mangrovi]